MTESPRAGREGVRAFTLTEATIADMQEAMAAGALSSVELAVRSLNRIFAYDTNGMRLNAVPIVNPDVLAEAAEADRLRAQGVVLGELHGVPFTVKDTYKVKGLTVAGGSPAFAELVASEDSFVVERARARGGVLIGKTNMPPLAAGGMQRGLYGRAESPYNPEYLTAAWDSGSSHGAGTSTAASFAAFGLGTETTSSGRSPASNNGLVAYTPSRGLISIRGSWPLFPIKDVVVPMTRTVADMFALLDSLVVEDPISTGDFWREQTAVELPAVGSVRPGSYHELARPDALRGKRVGVPTMYVGKDYSGSAPFSVRPSILELWAKAAEDLRSLGATVVEVDFEALHNYEEDRVASRGPVERGLLPASWWRFTDYATGTTAGTSLEFTKLNPFWSERFLRLNGDPRLSSWRDVDAGRVFPHPPESVDARRRGPCRDYSAVQAAIEGYHPVWTLPELDDALRGAERLREVDFEEWLAAKDLDLLVFPANADVGRADSDVNEASYVHASSNGVRCSGGNFMLRHLGIPSVSVSMGQMPDTGMPINLTFIGPAYTDNDLLSFAYAYEQFTRRRRPPTRVPPLPGETISYDPATLTPPAARERTTPPVLTLSARLRTGELDISGAVDTRSGIAEVLVWVNGQPVCIEQDGMRWSARVPRTKFTRPRVTLAERLSVIVLAKDVYGNTAAALEQIDAQPTEE